MAETIQYGRCVNRSRCTLAFNRETVFVPLDGNCPECGQPLQANSMASRRLNILPLLLTIGLLGAGGYYAKTRFLDPGPINPAGPHATPGGGVSNQVTPPPRTEPGGTPPADETPRGGVVDKPNFALEDDANAKARRDVLSRIDQMPHLSDAQKSKLLTAVDRARSMGCIFIIPFEAGKKALGPRETDVLVSGFKSGSIKQLMEDPTLVFVILGYADKQGDPKINEKASIDRAQNVLGIMRERCGVQNVTYGVGMGGSSRFDAKSVAKNRLVEIWAVYP